MFLIVERTGIGATVAELAQRITWREMVLWSAHWGLTAFEQEQAAEKARVKGAVASRGPRTRRYG